MVNFRTANLYVAKTLCVGALLLGTGMSANAQASDAEAKYSALLQQIQNLKMSIAHKEATVATQQERIKSLNAQLSEVDKVKDSVGPMVDKMYAAIDAEIQKDIPFNAEERFERLGDFRDKKDDKQVTPMEKMRRALNIYEAEVIYGQTFASYPGNHPIAEMQGKRYEACLSDQNSADCALTKDLTKKIEAGATIKDLKRDLEDGDYLRYGRLALVYAQAGGSQVYKFDAASKSWEEVTGGQALDFLQAIKMAKGEAAINVVKVPVLIAE